MTAFELMDRMTEEELLLWVEYDNTNISKQDYQYAKLMARLEIISGEKRADPKKYLPDVKKARRPRKSLGQIKANFFAAAANSGGGINHGGSGSLNQ